MANKDLLNRQRQALKAFLQAEDKRAETEQVLEETRTTNLSQTDSGFQSTKDAADSLLQTSHRYREEAHSKLISIKLQYLLTDLPDFVPEGSIDSFDASEELGKQASIVKVSSDAIISSVKSLNLNRVIRLARRRTILAVVAIVVIAAVIFGVIYFRDKLLPQQEAETQQQEMVAQVEGQVIASSEGPTSTPTPRSPTNTPTVTREPTSIPTRTKTPAPTKTPTVTREPTSTPTPATSKVVPQAACSFEPSGTFYRVWQAEQSRLGCALSEVKVFTAEQPFENGFMFWREDKREIYVLLSEGKTWQVFSDTWAPPQPQYSCPDVAPSQSPPTPLHGFGKVWCERLGGPSAAIGWATRQELGFDDDRWVDCEHGTMLWSGQWGDLWGVFVLYDDGTWQFK